jgi:FG-GAP-like repeat/Secretion system C-terminal sorting domain
MKTKILLLLVGVIFVNTYSQIGFQELIITTNADGAVSVYATDIDGDGDMDVLSASSLDDKIAWYENTDGQGSFGAQQIITTNADWAFSVYATDIDGDGDMDVFSASSLDDKIAWYENTNGQGSFGAQQIFTTNADGASSVYATDIDGDGDMDVLSASQLDDKIAWYENTDGQGSFGAQQIITSNAFGAFSVYATDIDGDGDMDVLSASIGGDKIAWYENTDGQGSFGAQQIFTTNADGASSVYATDIDGDGDMDVLSASFWDDKIAWYENTNGQGSFGAQQIITSNAIGAFSVYATDIDGDGDMDVLSASQLDDKIAWYENTDGQGSFGAQQIITTNADGAASVYATDIDGDGDMDVLSAAGTNDEIAWYENLGVLGVDQNTLLSFSVQPIPTTGILTIQSSTTIVQIEIYNQLGQLVISNSNNPPAGRAGNTIDISSVSQGIYFIKLIDEYGNIGNQKVVKK